MQCRSVARFLTGAPLFEEHSGRVAERPPRPRSRTHCRSPTDNGAKAFSTCPYQVVQGLQMQSLVYSCLEIASSRLFHFNQFKQRCKISLAKSAAALALDHLEKHRRTVLHRLRENLQQVTLLVAVDKYAQRFQLVNRFFQRS